MPTIHLTSEDIQFWSIQMLLDPLAFLKTVDLQYHNPACPPLLANLLLKLFLENHGNANSWNRLLRAGIMGIVKRASTSTEGEAVVLLSFIDSQPQAKLLRLKA
jgi:hypothetical protein